LFVAGGAIAGVDTGTIFIENGRFHGEDHRSDRLTWLTIASADEPTFLSGSNAFIQFLGGSRASHAFTKIRFLVATHAKSRQ
jgi:hypothetical protein